METSLENSIHENLKIFVDWTPFNQWHNRPFWKGEPLSRYNPDSSSRELFHLHIGNGHYLLKTDVNPRVQQCYREFAVYKSIEPEDLQYFAPTITGGGISGGGGWNVMPFLVLKMQNISKELRGIVEVLEHKYSLVDMIPNLNWFKYEDKPLIVDYGMTEEDLRS